MTTQSFFYDRSDDLQVVDDETRKLVRASDPITSVMAAESTTRFRKTQKGRILTALEKLGMADASQIAAHLGMTVVQVDRRLPEAQRDGTAEVVQLAGEDMLHGKYRVWRRTGKPCE